MAATDNEIILRVDGSQAITTLRELKDAITADKDALVALGLAEEADEATKKKIAEVTAKLAKDTKLLNEVMVASKGVTLDTAKAIDTTTASYYDMQRALTTLKKAWKDMTAEERASADGGEILHKIKQLDAELKTLDADIGQYQRNVGNYGQTFKQSLDQAQQGANGLQQGITAMTAIMATAGIQSDGLTKTLLGLSAAAQLVIGARGIGELITKGKEAINTLRGAKAATDAATASTKAQGAATEAAATATKGATAATKGLKVALASLGIGAVIVALTELVKHLDDVKEMIGGETFDTDKLDALQRSTAAANAEFDRQLTLLKAIGEESAASLGREVVYSRSLIDSYAELLGEAKGAVEDVTFFESIFGSDTDYENYQTMFDAYNEQLQAFKDKVAEGAAALGGYLHEAQKSRQYDGMTQLEQDLDRISSKAESMRTLLKNMGDAYTPEQRAAILKGIDDTEAYYTKKAEDADKQRQADAAKRAAERAAADAARRKQKEEAELASAQKIADAAADYYKSDTEKLTEKYEADKALLEAHGIDTTDLTKKYNADLQAIADREKEKEAQAQAERLKAAEENAAALRDIAKQTADYRIDQLDRETDVALRRAATTAKNDEDLAAAEYDIQRKANEDRLALLAQYALQAAFLGDQTTALEYQKQAADLSVEIELNAAEEKKRILDREKANRKQAAQDALASVSSIFGSLADLAETNGESDKKRQQQAKNLRIAGATIDMLSGVVTAIAQAQELGPVLGPIMAGVNSAAVIAAGVANIAKIKATDVSGTSSGSSSASAVASAPVVLPAVAAMPTTTGASTEDLLNRATSSQRVYILASDIEASNEQRRVEVAETTF